MQRNETHLDFQTTATYLTQVQPLVDAGQAVPLFSVGELDGNEIVRDPNLPDVPTLSEIVGGDSLAYRAFRSFAAPGFFFQKGLWTNSETDQRVLDNYDSMVKALNADPEFLDEAKDALGGYSLLSGPEVRDQFRSALTIPEDVLNYTKDFLLNKHGSALH
ncbi:Tricarboxylate transport protein TctC [Micrococcus lylae]|uniref:Tricarboxylate transport protein TctC n=1 Tax=Micrococcus lylae TaxID=1273 RepID=A0A1R4IZB2_9MICC|nr:Tricarboxylate transport protein TctC [Micrococcus lylae]